MAKEVFAGKATLVKQERPYGVPKRNRNDPTAQRGHNGVSSVVTDWTAPKTLAPGDSERKKRHHLARTNVD